MDIVLAPRFERELVDHGAQSKNLVVAVLVTGPGAKDVGVTGHLLLCRCTLVSCVLLEAVGVLLAASFHGRRPIDLAVVDLLFVAPELISTSLFRLAVHVKTTLIARVRVAIGTKTTEAVETLLVIEAKLLVGTEERRSHVLRNTGIGVDVGEIDSLLLIEIALLYLVVLLEVLGRVEFVRVERLHLERWLLVFLGHVRPLWLDVVFWVGALRVLDKVLLRHPVTVGNERANAVEEAI